MTTIGDIANYLDQIFPPIYQEDYDNSGFMIGEPDTEATGVVVALDLTPEAIAFALQSGSNLIVTHHPPIFTGLKTLTNQTLLEQMVKTLIRNNISLHSAHTNLDNMLSGVNGILATKLGLTNCHILRPAERFAAPTVGSGIVGELPSPMPFAQFADRVKKTLNIPLLRCSAPCHHTVQRIALCGGAGSFLIADAIATGADIFVTADLKYHDFQRAEGRIVLVDAGHYESEQFAKELIYCEISKKFRNFAVLMFDGESGFVSYI